MCSRVHLSICPPPVSAIRPLLLDCLYVPLEWHISTSFIRKENSSHIWLSNSEGLSQLEVTINCWAVTHFIVGCYLFLISNKVAAGKNWQGRSCFLLVGEIQKKKGKRERERYLHESWIMQVVSYHGKEIIFSTRPINTIDLCHKRQVAYIHIPLKGIILQSLLQYY